VALPAGESRTSTRGKDKNMNRLLKSWPLVVLAVACMIATVTTTATGASMVKARAASSAPTASINVWLVTNGTNVNNLWAQLASRFDKNHKGDHVTVEIQPSSNSYKAKITTALAGSKPPALFFSWGGGPLQEYVKAGVVQPFADPGVSDAGNPSWTKDFLASTLDAVTFNKKIYGMPILGTQPVFFFYNKSVFSKYGLSFPTTWSELLSDVSTFNSHSIVPIALGNADEWEGLMYLEYLTDRAGGPQAFLKVESNAKGAWSQPAIQTALADIQTLAKDKAFNVGYDSITYTNGSTDALVYSGKAAMQLMGDWDVGGIQSDDPTFVNSGGLGIGAFPTLPGGKGNVADLEGNTTSYAALAAHISSAKTYVAEEFMKSVFDTKTYAKQEIADGQVAVISGTSGLLSSSSISQYLVPVYNSVVKAPYFQYSWDQALGLVKATPMLDNLSKVFELTETPAQFAAAMNPLQRGS
jgi:raffinose/stachyose/melibiose transport system substrate-binding protein